jgi:hypothetical protein
MNLISGVRCESRCLVAFIVIDGGAGGFDVVLDARRGKSRELSVGEEELGEY